MVVQFLIKNIKGFSGAVISRGYGRKSSEKNLIVSDGHTILTSISAAGDEPYMMALDLKVPVVVGSNRAKSIELLLNLFSVKKNKNSKETFNVINFVVLDDAYQNFQVKKDLEILLLDAENPFENGHCLPAGRLREKDYSRADVIILTHCERVSQDHIDKVKQSFLQNNKYGKALTLNVSSENASFDNIFASYHKTSSVLLLNEKEIEFSDLKDERLLAFAGIGRFDLFLSTLEESDLQVCSKVEYSDHYNYKMSDIEFLLYTYTKGNCSGFITTVKDWHKIFSVLRSLKHYRLIPLYVLDIELEFGDSGEKDRFLKKILDVMNE